MAGAHDCHHKRVRIAPPRNSRHVPQKEELRLGGSRGGELLQIDITGRWEGLVAVRCGHVRHRCGRNDRLCGESRSAARRRRQRELRDNSRNLWRTLAVETKTLTARAWISWQKVAADLGSLASLADARWRWHDDDSLPSCRRKCQQGTPRARVSSRAAVVLGCEMKSCMNS